MSATLPNSNLAHTKSDVIWSRGGGSFWRLVWKEINEAVGIWWVIAIATVCSASLVDRRAIESPPAILLHAAPALFALIFGARAFAHEVAGGTWELLRSIGASAFDVVGSKWLVGVTGSVLMMGLSIALATLLRLRLRIAELGEPTVWYLLVVLLSLAVSLLVSQWSRIVWKALALSGVACVPLWAWWAAGFEDFFLLTTRFRWQTNVVLCLAIAVLPTLWAIQMWSVSRNLLDHSGVVGSQRWWQVCCRMLWKELLSVRDFWLAVLGIVIVFDVGAYFLFRVVETREIALVALGVLMPLLHSLGCGAITFALEREDGTQDWLRRISAPAGAVFAAKLLVSQASIVSLTSLILLGTQAVVAPANRLTNDGCATLLMATTLNGVVSLGTSLLTKRVLPAMFLAFVGVVAIDLPLLVSGFGAVNKGQPFWVFPLAILPWWLLVGTALLATEWRLADRWLNERRWWPRRWRGETLRAMPSRGPEFWFDWSSSPEKKALGRCLWREWMEAKGWLWAFPLVFVPSLNYDMLDFVQRTGQNTVVWTMKFLLIPACWLLTFGLCVLPALLGVWAFHHDQRQGLFRFLANRGGSPQRIWQSKQAVWLPLVLMLAGLAGVIIELQTSFSHLNGLAPGLLTGFALIFALQSYAAGQAMSQWNRSALISMFLAGVLSLLLWGWTLLLAQEVHAPWPYQLGVAAILFFASWRSSRDWLEERWSWRVWLRIALSTVLPFIALVLLLELQGYRVWDVLRNWTGVRSGQTACEERSPGLNNPTPVRRRSDW